MDRPLTAPARPPDGDGKRNPDALAVLADVASSLGATDLVSRIDTFRRRTEAAQFYVACVGTFKRGKSTLINALLGHELLPTGFLPATTAPTIIRYADALRVDVDFVDGTSRRASTDTLATYVAHRGQTPAARSVEAVRVGIPCALLACGLSLVDTPGLGSAFTGDSAATHAFVPQMDAALLVVGADPPITAEEIEVAAALARGGAPLLVVLNKADRFKPEEMAAAATFARDMLNEALGVTNPGSPAQHPSVRVLKVSATERLAGVGSPRDWPHLIADLTRLASVQRRALVDAARVRGTRRLADACFQVVNAQHAALFRTRDEADRCLDALRAAAARAAYEALQLGFRARSDLDTMLRNSRTRRTTFLEESRYAITRELRERLGTAPSGTAATWRARSMAAARAVAARWLAPWARDERQAAEAWFRQTSDALAAEAARILASAGAALSGEAGIVADRDGCTESAPVDAVAAVDDTPVPRVGRMRRGCERLLPAGWVNEHIARDARTYLLACFAREAASVENGVQRRAEARNRRLATAVHDALRERFALAERAAERARTVRDAGAGEFRAQLARLDALRATVAATIAGRPTPE